MAKKVSAKGRKAAKCLASIPNPDRDGESPHVCDKPKGHDGLHQCYCCELLFGSRRKPRMFTVAQIKALAGDIADHLFTEGGSQSKARRLVLEFRDGQFPGSSGWCRDAVRDVILDRVTAIRKGAQ